MNAAAFPTHKILIEPIDLKPHEQRHLIRIPQVARDGSHFHVEGLSRVVDEHHDNRANDPGFFTVIALFKRFGGEGKSAFHFGRSGRGALN